MNTLTAHVTSCQSDEGQDHAQDSQGSWGKGKRKNTLDSLPALTGLRLGINASVGPSGRVCSLQ